MKRTKLRMISAALAACMMASVLPLGAMAQGGGEKAENSVSVLDVSSAPTTDEEKEAQGWVKIDEKNFPDDNFRKIVKNHYTWPYGTYPAVKFDQDNDGWLSPEEIADVKSICCDPYSRQIEKLTGIEYFTALEILSCIGTELTELDVSKNKALTRLDCSKNQLTKLDVSKNKALTRLDCSYNQLTELNVSKNTALTRLDCEGNQLTKLNVSNGTALTTLFCFSNQLKELVVSNNTELAILACESNQLKELDVSKNTALYHLRCSANQLTSLDLEETKISNNYSQPLCDENSYNIEVDSENRFNLRNLPGKFNVNKASDWDGGSVEGTILTVDQDVDTVTYTYDCGTNQAGDHFSVKFTLKVTGHDASPVEPDIPADGGDTDDAADNIKGALSAVVVGAVAGAIIYETGTGIYRVINMPGIAMPADRGELAMLLWEHAGKPEPVSTALYSDIEDNIDLNKAARWAVEQGLMQDDADNNKFNPHFPVSKLRTCLTWNAAKEKGLFDTDKTAE